MKRSIDVKSQAEGDALVRSLEDPTLRAVILVGGVLADLPRHARRSVLAFCAANLDEVPRDATPMPSFESGPSPLRLHDGAGVARSTGE